MKLKNITSKILLLFIVMVAMGACRKDDSKLDYGLSKIYMPQSFNTGKSVYSVPGFASNSSPTSANYQLDTIAKKINVLLGAALSGTNTGAFSVDIAVNTDTVQKLLASGAYGTDYMLMPASVYRLPSKLEVPASGSASFSLSLDIQQLIQNRDVFSGKHLLLAVKIANPSKYELDVAKSTTIIDYVFSDKLIGYPVINGASEYNFSGGERVTIYGANLQKVSRISFKGSSAPLPIRFISADSIGITLPTPDAGFIRSALDIINPTAPVSTSFEFVNLNNTVPIFTEGYAPGYEAAWWAPITPSTDVSKRGQTSLKISYNDFAVGGIANYGPGFVFNADYKYLTFWVKGDGNDHTIYLSGSGRITDYGNTDRSTPILVPKNVWTYVKLPLNTLNLWSKGNSFQLLGWIVPENGAQLLYFDDVLFVK
ncbi:DUF1735 domain-containing protein [Pedobacter nutrimenti]|jgi:hypothetical protein|uniref:Uncharacterized protein DUF1735 n=1 Tax=Pedobacter nutrimenti TaxID=1241337 RepID=A0A318UEF8_9SPHI|nr:DUF1735 domain-containing protein [Pedobacter nutrimenti]PYF74776.1 uncharacterized protein DUF1735 [Pedobacter nutrimenti]